MSRNKIVTRGSDLALYQSGLVRDHLNKNSLLSELQVIKTRGDKDYRPLKELKGDGFFTKELEYELLNKAAQYAVHSSKDLPSTVHADLPWKAILNREAPEDVLIINKHNVISRKPLTLRQGTRIGTSSPRRVSQAQAQFTGIELVDLRGNVPTRLQQAISGELDAVILAKAGLQRLGLTKKLPDHIEMITLDWVTAPCQGILGIQWNSSETPEPTKILNHELTEIAQFEKKFLSFMGAGCHLALGAQIKKGDNFELEFYFDSQSEKHSFKESDKNCVNLVQKGFSKIVGADTTNSCVWITSPLPQQKRIGKLLVESGHSPIFFPLIEVAPKFETSICESAKKNISSYDAIAFGSQFGAKYFLQEVGAFCWDALSRIQLFAVGEKTAQLLRNEGLKVKVPQEATAAELSELIVTSGANSALVPGSAETKIIGYLKKAKVNVQGLELYCSSPVSYSTLPSNPSPSQTIVFTSPSTVRAYNLVTESFPDLINMKKIAIGPTTAKELEASGYSDFVVSKKSGDWTEVCKLIS